MILVIVLFNLKNLLRTMTNFIELITINSIIFLAILEKGYTPEITDSGLEVYQTNGHCWNVPSPCVHRLGELTLKTDKKYGYYFFVGFKE